MKTCKHFAQVFLDRLSNMPGDYDEVRVVFDRYTNTSLKEKMRRKRTKRKSTYYQVKDTTLIQNISLKDFLSNIKTKAELTTYLAVDTRLPCSNRIGHVWTVFRENQILVLQNVYGPAIFRAPISITRRIRPCWNDLSANYTSPKYTQKRTSFGGSCTPTAQLRGESTFHKRLAHSTTMNESTMKLRIYTKCFYHRDNLFRLNV